jgi:hypothetical protein
VYSVHRVEAEEEGVVHGVEGEGWRVRREKGGRG